MSAKALRRLCTLGLLVVATWGCAKVPVRAHLEEWDTGKPIEHVTLPVIPPIRWYPTFPAASGQTDGNGDTLLRMPTDDKLWQCLFEWRGRPYRSLVRIEKGMLDYPTERSELTPADYEPGPSVRLTLEQIAKQQ